MLVAEQVCPVQNLLGESPVWQADEQALYWVDIRRSRVYRWEPGSAGFRVLETDVAITCLRPRVRGGWVAATGSGFAFWDSERRDVDLIAHPQAELAHTWFNDGAVDCAGRFWAGTASTGKEGSTPPDGALYRLDPDLSWRQADSGFTISNGIGWSPDDRSMYFTDTLRSTIYVYDFDPLSGAIDDRRCFVQIPVQDGYPDGLAVDSEGCIWSALWGGWKVARFDPHGRLVEEVRLPVANVSCCAFGGADLKDLYITSARPASEQDLRRQPLAGALFRARVQVRGQDLPRFAA